MSRKDEGPTVKTLRSTLRGAGRHWVGDGFPVRTLFAYPESGSVLSPFLLLDHAGPAEFPSTTARRGVGEHPHRGFETVTIVYEGEVEHRDSSGGGGTIGPGDVQWMTAASGVVHEEFHGRAFARRGGRFEVVQLWVNLPAREKMSAPRYQGIAKRDIPVVDLPDGRGTVRVIAGAFAGIKGPATTCTPLDVWDLRLAGNGRADLAVTEGHTTALVVLEGAVRVPGGATIGAAEVGVFERAGDTLRIDVTGDARALVLLGEPIDEPIVGSGPFVMNTAEEVRQAHADYRNGTMGRLPGAVGPGTER